LQYDDLCAFSFAKAGHLRDTSVKLWISILTFCISYDQNVHLHRFTAQTKMEDHPHQKLR
jgi:hypothetical protein